MTTFQLALSKRRQQMADEIGSDHSDRSVDFDYRRRVTDDVEAILREAEVFKPTGTVSADDRYEQDVLLRRLAEDLVRYIIQ